MPVIHEGDPMPSWSELLRFETIRGAGGTSRPLPASEFQQKLVVVSGRVRLGDAETAELAGGAVFDLERRGAEPVTFVETSVVVWLSGAWSEHTGRSGVFTPHDIASPVEGDPADYPKETAFDNHFHDCDEHWIIVEGTGTVVTEGTPYEVRPGDCVSTRTGYLR